MKHAGLNLFKLLCAIMIFSLIGENSSAKDNSRSEGLLRYVDQYIGAGGHGHVFVGTSVPYGMVQLGPNNIFKGWDWCSGYNYSDNIIIGFSHTHLSGTGCGDMGDVLIMPFTGQVHTDKGIQKDISNGYASCFSHDKEIVSPQYYSVVLDKYNIRAELTSTARVGFHKYTYPQGEKSQIIIDLKEGISSGSYDSYIKKVDDYTIEGYRFIHGWSPNRKVYFVLKSNVKINDFSAYDDNTSEKGDELKAKYVKGVVSFGNARVVMLKVGISSVSCQNAAMNINTEIKDWNFNSVVSLNAAKWNKALSEISLKTKNEKAEKILYTSFYHTMIAPSLYCDYNGEYSGYDGKIHKDNNKSNYSTFSLWDTYRAAQPLMTILHPELVPKMVNSMLSIYDQQGKLPIWPLWGGETNCMPGCNAIPIIADACMKGFKGFDIKRAYNAMKVSAMNRKQSGISYLIGGNYIPCDEIGAATSKALEYAIDDWGVAAVAKKLNIKKDAEMFSDMSQYYKNYFDSTNGFMRPKLKNGSWFGPYNPATADQKYFTEGNGWQYTFLVPQDPRGLINLFGGDNAFANKLDELFNNHDSMGPNAVNDISGLIGQYAHGNEPSHHIAYMYAYAGEQWKTAKLVRYIMDEFYTDKEDGIIGNEDCGQMSAWYVLSAMGLYQVSPSKGVFVFGSPRFDKFAINVCNGKTFSIEAINNNEKNIYIQKVELNGKVYHNSYILYNDIVKGGHLKFYMGNTPNYNFGKNPVNRPY